MDKLSSAKEYVSSMTTHEIIIVVLGFIILILAIIVLVMFFRRKRSSPEVAGAAEGDENTVPSIESVFERFIMQNPKISGLSPKLLSGNTEEVNIEITSLGSPKEEDIIAIFDTEVMKKDEKCYTVVDSVNKLGRVVNIHIKTDESSEDAVVGSAEDAGFSLFVKPEVFEDIKSGKRTVESRAGSLEKWGDKKGMDCEFINTGNREEKITKKITSVKHYETISDLIEGEGLAKVMPRAKTKAAALEAYAVFYPDDLIKKRGGICAMRLS